MASSTADLSALARSKAPDAHAAAHAAAVPPPRARWRTRVLLPGAILTLTVIVLVASAGSALWPATSVRVVPAIVKAGAPTGGQVIVQAPGWVEADPFPIAVSALADGIVSDVLVLEGQAVEPNQVVARLIDADARLALERVAAQLDESEAAQAVAQADLDAAQREWDNPVELQRKNATLDAELAEKQAELARWPAELEAETSLAQYKEAEFERIKPLFEIGQASQIEFVRVQKEFENQKAVAESTRSRKPMIEAQIRAPARTCACASASSGRWKPAVRVLPKRGRP